MKLLQTILLLTLGIFNFIHASDGEDLITNTFTVENTLPMYDDSFMQEDAPEIGPYEAHKRITNGKVNFSLSPITPHFNVSCDGQTSDEVYEKGILINQESTKEIHIQNTTEMLYKYKANPIQI